MVVIGRSSRTADEVDLEYCRAEGIPVLRRCSGGAAVVVGPGCLMYSVVLAGFVLMTWRALDVARLNWRRGASVLEQPELADGHGEPPAVTGR